ncbi:MAG TPA: AbrB family transcriptional regulator, partial [Ruminococcaceae bacterium]|nr:AbrB family transcriptional regulator [Oscillospiraceae bacterium]
MLKDNLIMLRGIHGYSQEEIAEKINISRQAY